MNELRKLRKITQEESAESVKITRQTIISIENGNYNASLILLHKITKFFELSIEEVFIFE
ncbi:helix-turn-helix transcriptional regulator [Clostridium neonatale]|uniref:helix-turn-helix transcriptional regulator n=1 Tax=Clostridium neonatale TaxID=137838 RepID=UPI003D326ADE